MVNLTPLIVLAFILWTVAVAAIVIFVLPGIRRWVSLKIIAWKIRRISKRKKDSELRKKLEDLADKLETINKSTFK